MLTYPVIDSVALSLGPFDIFGKTVGPLEVHWYGIMYLLGFAGAWFLAMRRAARPGAACQPTQVEDLIVYGAMGVVLGGRCGYVLFYHFDRFLMDPAWLFRVWEGGMSFHGGLLGVLVAMALYARKIQVRFFDLTDFIAPLVPLGLGLGRLGNFIGQELWGRASDVPWAMVFPKDPLQLARHPSQLYQAALEGLVLFVVLVWFSSRPRPRMAVSGLFLFLYGCFRFTVEFFREPDSFIGFDAFGWVTRGQLLSLPMIVLGAVLLFLAYRGRSTSQSPANGRKASAK
ncbi:prolipoprotein diacylglyceryl transferase [Aestuariicella hydrocarbonica]|uniref:Phosphatidylglycerol--prolipoprotein diacylglyceryl transferase n=1 Tax=Pseudomaricurvus hydrocarbonicus TaxID=1470433 RepID=A0A9E5MKI9_9GAMM|nr:prolipoprotein diacylglyceryl transferase [Aestuariicella hydrocarbonica]NHO66594.1 prolipoprotein diacylglyceryl transferase [Aestuariicella hydrocarbonica]